MEWRNEIGHDFWLSIRDRNVSLLMLWYLMSISEQVPHHHNNVNNNINRTKCHCWEKIIYFLTVLWILNIEVIFFFYSTHSCLCIPSYTQIYNGKLNQLFDLQIDISLTLACYANLKWKKKLHIHYFEFICLNRNFDFINLCFDKNDKKKLLILNKQTKIRLLSFTFTIFISECVVFINV